MYGRGQLMFRDFRFAFRVLASRPVFALVAAVSSGLGMGANFAIVGLIDALWFRPLAVPHSDEIVRVFSVTDQDREASFSYPEYLDLKRAGTLREVIAIGGRGATLLEGESRELHTLNLASSQFFTAFEVKPAFGRLFTPQDETNSDAPPAVVLGNSFWERHYGADANIIGKQIRIQRANEVLFTVIGVLPKNFRGLVAARVPGVWGLGKEWGRPGPLPGCSKQD